jgi:hypothetical protein
MLVESRDDVWSMRNTIEKLEFVEQGGRHCKVGVASTGDGSKKCKGTIAGVEASPRRIRL